MPLFWLFVCIYLLISIIGLLEADIRPMPGHKPSWFRVAGVALCFALGYPITTFVRWVADRS